MTKLFTPRRPRFICVPGTDGCDETVDIVSQTTGRVVARAPFWSERNQARRAARRLAAALNATYGRVDFDIPGLLDAHRKIASIWQVEVVLSVRPDLTDDQAWQVLLLAEQRHDCTIGLNWQCLETAAESLYGNAPEQGGSDE